MKTMLEELDRPVLNIGPVIDRSPAPLRARPNHTATQIDLVLRICADHYRVTVADLLGPSRKSEHCEARRAVMWILHEHLLLQNSTIGRILHRTHSLVSHANTVTEWYRDLYPSYRATIDALIAKIQLVLHPRVPYFPQVQ
jgi:chromosomal replication initiation ATPase DnaA